MGTKDTRSGKSAGKTIIYLHQTKPGNLALTLREANDSHWNNAWICRQHGSLSFKVDGAKGNTRFLIRELSEQGVQVTELPEWEASDKGRTCCGSGVGYEGHLKLGTPEKAVKFLKRFFDVRACPVNNQEDQKWVDNL